MNENIDLATWETLRQIGFEADPSPFSDIKPALAYDFGNFKLSASAVTNRWLQPVVLFTGNLFTLRTAAEIEFETPRGLSRELLAAWIVWNLDRVSPDRRFVPQRETQWLSVGREHQHLLPWEVTRAQRAEQEALYAARPHCCIDRGVFRLTLNTLEDVLTRADASEPVLTAFDGRVLSFVCNAVDTAVVATGTAWPVQCRVGSTELLHVLPRRLRAPTVQVGIWKAMLEIDRARCPIQKQTPFRSKPDSAK